MTALNPIRRHGSSQAGLKILACVLTAVCAVLFLLAIEQKQMLEVWATVRDGASPTAQRAVGWISNTAASGASSLKQAAEGRPPPVAATPTDVILSGEFTPMVETAAEAEGDVTFDGGRIVFGSGETLQTRPLRIAAGGDVFSDGGQTFAERLDAPEDAQIELRQVIEPRGQRRVASSPLCGGMSPGAVALLYRRERVDMMIFREPTPPGPDAPATALCGVWAFRAR